MNSYDRVLEWIKATWNIELFQLGENQFMIKTIIILLFSFFLLFYLSGMIKRVLANRIFPRYNIDIGVGQSIATIVRYL